MTAVLGTTLSALSTWFHLILKTTWEALTIIHVYGDEGTGLEKVTITKI